jgi:pimeloyl-ACP methyl ester carboxylesterase
MPFVPTRLGDVAYEIQGSGPPVVMLHATLHDRRDYNTIAGTLARHYQTIAIDWPWHGESKGLGSTETLSAVALADVLEDVANALELRPAFYIGNSVGGFAAARLAITHPHLVRGLILVNCGGFLEWAPARRLFCRILGIPFVARQVFPIMIPRYMAAQTADDKAIATRSKERAGTTTGSAVAAALWRSFSDPGHDLRSQSAQIKAPTLIAWGSRDIVFSAGDGSAVQNCILGSRIEVFDCGHVVFSSKPTEFLAVVEPFLQSVCEADQGHAV